MQNKLLRKRSLIETVNDQLENICQIEHTRHRSPHHFVAHLLAGLTAYCHQPEKTSLRFDPPVENRPALTAQPEFKLINWGCH